MSTFPLAFQVVRRGATETVRVDSPAELLRLRTELELIRQCGRGADDAVRNALRAAETATPRDDREELLEILHEATSPLVADAIGQIDRDFPDVRREVASEVIASEAAAFREDVAAAVREAALPGADALADAYMQRSRVATPNAEPSAEPSGTARSDPGPASPPTPHEERSTMSENPGNPQNADARPVNPNRDRPVEGPDPVAPGESNEPALDIDAIITGAAGADQPVTPEPGAPSPDGPGDSPHQGGIDPPPAAADDDAKIDLASFEQANGTDLDEGPNLGDFLAEAMARVDAVGPLDPEPPADAPMSGPEQLEQLARGKPRPPAEGSTDVAETMEAALDDVESHMSELTSGLDSDATEEPATVPPSRVDLDESTTADEVLTDVEDVAAALADAVGRPPEPDGETPPPADAAEAMPTPTPEAAVALPASDSPESPVPEAQTPAAADPATSAATDAGTAESPASGPANGAVDEIENGLARLARFLSGEVLQLWTQARQAMQEARAFRDDAERMHAEACRMRAEIETLGQAVAETRDQTQSHQQEARNLRDDIRQTIERIRQCADEAANAADAAQAEARNAATFAERARSTRRPEE
jgi:hypothetical protein